MLDCLFIGSATKDILMMVDAPPASDQRIAARAVPHACGGIASVAASAFQKLGGRAGLITAVGGSSEVTDFIRADIAGRQLPFVQLVEMDGMDSPFSVIQVERSGKRCITYFGGCIRALTLDMLDKEALKSARMIHLGGLDEGLLVEAAAYAKGHTDALVSVDGGNAGPSAGGGLPVLCRKGRRYGVHHLGRAGIHCAGERGHLPGSAHCGSGGGYNGRGR